MSVDFYMGMVIAIGTLAFVLFLGNMMVGATEAVDRSEDLTGFRVGDRLVDDVLATGPNDATVTPACAEAYFNAENATAEALSCEYGGFDATNESTYLATSLGLSPEYTLNVSVRGETGILQGDYDTNGITVQYALGPKPPTGGYATVHRMFAFTTDIDGDGTREPYTLYVSIWEH